MVNSWPGLGVICRNIRFATHLQVVCILVLLDSFQLDSVAVTVQFGIFARVKAAVIRLGCSTPKSSFVAVTRRVARLLLSLPG